MPHSSTVGIPVAMLMEIFAGILIRPSVLGWLQPTEFLSAMSDIGAMFLLFRVGLEVNRRSC
jgi:Kef-type K+ transport system membrane component KefB